MLSEKWINITEEFRDELYAEIKQLKAEVERLTKELEAREDSR